MLQQVACSLSSNFMHNGTTIPNIKASTAPTGAAIDQAGPEVTPVFISGWNQYDEDWSCETNHYRKLWNRRYLSDVSL